VQVDPVKPMLKLPRSKRLRLEHEKLLSNFAFNFILCRYSEVLKLEAGTRFLAATKSLARWVAR